jgi:predicted CopG family antitoxin
MAHKTISLNKESYRILKKLKRDYETYSDLIIRLFGRKKSVMADPLLEYAGVFSDDDFWKDFENIIQEQRNSNLSQEFPQKKTNK